MKVIVGLGNVGSEYERTRHNVGFQVVDVLRERRKLRWQRGPSYQYTGWDSTRDTTVRLVQPHTMMNRSGEAVRLLVQAWHVVPTDLLIVCDDVNLPLGTLRMRAGGSDGGQHGLASCVEALGTEDVPRLRCGVGTTPLPPELAEFVLSEFRPEECERAHQMIARAAEACERWCEDGIETTMNRVNAL